MGRRVYPKSIETPGCWLSDDRRGANGSCSINNNNKNNNDRRDADAPRVFGRTHRVIPASQRRGIAIISFVVAMLVMGAFALWLSRGTATTATSSLSHYFGTGAFYAAESGLEMSLRELNQGSDIDGDKINSGGINGTISDDVPPNSANDPALATGAVFVKRMSTNPDVYRATGRPNQTIPPWSRYRRMLEIRVK